MKQLFVSSEVQVILLKEIILQEMKNGYWKNHRPVNHAFAWDDVQFVVSNDKLGPENFIIPRTYNFTNPEFLIPNQDKIIQIVSKIKPNYKFKMIKRELVKLSQIVGGRLTNNNSLPIKAYRGEYQRGKINTKTSIKKEVKPKISLPINSIFNMKDLYE